MIYSYFILYEAVNTLAVLSKSERKTLENSPIARKGKRLNSDFEHFEEKLKNEAKVHEFLQKSFYIKLSERIQVWQYPKT